ncbi:hypothetical protein E2C01_026006 [Portunus trituberculatus]|uniref:Secreted protein n=1 Tax=Portunus trituberculatus TaxID=210409 RepID=A0A5B7EEY3_PORTR|nr:hypothetical protein [Portunus trituberculatus]
MTVVPTQEPACPRAAVLLLFLLQARLLAYLGRAPTTLHLNTRPVPLTTVHNGELGLVASRSRAASGTGASPPQPLVCRKDTIQPNVVGT